MNPDLERLGYTLKKEKHRKTHIDSAVYSQVMQEADEKMEKAKEIEVFNDRIREIEEHEHEIQHGRSKKDMVIKTIPEKRNQEEMVLISSSDFNSMYAVTEIERTKRLVESTKKEIEKEQKAISSKLELGADESLKQENERLQKEIYDRDSKILTLNKELSKSRVTIENQKLAIKQLLRLIQDTVPRLLERAKQILNDIFKKEPEIERSR